MQSSLLCTSGVCLQIGSPLLNTLSFGGERLCPAAANKALTVVGELEEAPQTT